MTTKVLKAQLMEVIQEQKSRNATQAAMGVKQEEMLKQQAEMAKKHDDMNSDIQALLEMMQ